MESMHKKHKRVVCRVVGEGDTHQLEFLRFDGGTCHAGIVAYLVCEIHFRVDEHKAEVGRKEVKIPRSSSLQYDRDG